MEFTNFRLLPDFISIEMTDGSDEVLDLHNFGILLGFSYDSIDHKLALNFDIVTGWQGPTVKKLEILFTDVDYLAVTPRDPQMPFNEDDSVESISVVPADSDMSEIVERHTTAIIPSGGWKPDDNYHLMLRLWGGQIIRVGAARTEAKIVPV